MRPKYDECMPVRNFTSHIGICHGILCQHLDSRAIAALCTVKPEYGKCAVQIDMRPYAGVDKSDADTTASE